MMELAGEGLFCSDERVNREGMQERLLDAFDAAMTKARSGQHQPEHCRHGEQPQSTG